MSWVYNKQRVSWKIDFCQSNGGLCVRCYTTQNGSWRLGIRFWWPDGMLMTQIIMLNGGICTKKILIGSNYEHGLWRRNSGKSYTLLYKHPPLILFGKHGKIQTPSNSTHNYERTGYRKCGSCTWKGFKNCLNLTTQYNVIVGCVCQKCCCCIKSSIQNKGCDDATLVFVLEGIQ